MLTLTTVAPDAFSRRRSPPDASAAQSVAHRAKRRTPRKASHTTQSVACRSMRRAPRDVTVCPLGAWVSVSVNCYLSASYDGAQPGRCPTLYYRETSSVLHDVRVHEMWVALEAGSGIVPQHDYDPQSSCAGWEGCEYWSHGQPGAWWNVSADPIGGGAIDGGASASLTSPLWAFVRERALNRLALRTKLPILEASGAIDGAAVDGGALVYLKHDALGPDGDAALLVYNPGRAQTLTIDLSLLPDELLTGRIMPRDLLRTDARDATGGDARGTAEGAGAKSAGAAPHGLPAVRARIPPLSRHWTVEMGELEVAAFGGFRLGVFAPRRGKVLACAADDEYKSAARAHTLQGCFLECLADPRCEHLLRTRRLTPHQAPA